ncbi:Hypothetical protein SCLAV_5699 [Streptomyces clavuligerus]|uniref:Uncharacterized protein n=2 Tax=Streptomyces clavuligerus TaxID=1901 RepID=E2Q2Q5_STRCL|nr:Hypothetical protein SCLAV_5699 [Streptomyces clavuligerus]
MEREGGRSPPGRAVAGGRMEYAERYELVFPASGTEDDAVVVRRTERTGAGGHPVYEDETGIVRAEITERGEIRMLASGGHQAPGLPVTVRPLGD